VPEDVGAGGKRASRSAKVDLGKPGPDGFYGSGWDSLAFIWPTRLRNADAPGEGELTEGGIEVNPVPRLSDELRAVE